MSAGESDQSVSEPAAAENPDPPADRPGDGAQVVPPFVPPPPWAHLPDLFAESSNDVDAAAAALTVVKKAVARRRNAAKKRAAAKKKAAAKQAAAEQAAARKAAAAEAARKKAAARRLELAASRRPVDPSAPLSVSVRGLRIDYEIFTDRRAGLRSRFVDRGVAGRSVVPAIQGIDLDVREGESVGVIGYNGSGKSTLLSAIAGVLPASAGDVLVSAEPRLMGVGAALIPRATGYRNIRLGCLALGMTADEVDDRIDELVDFTDLGEAIHRALNTYSSGMRARVHFTIATAVTPRILLIDEALAVGDRRFRAKSRDRINEIISDAGTLIMVNHSLGELQEYCSRGVWLDSGRVRLDGPIDDVIEAYLRDDD